MGIGELASIRLSTTTESSQSSVPLCLSQASVPYLVVKRALDIVVAAIALVALTPLLVLIAIVVKLSSPGPAIYAQRRVRGNQDPNESHPEHNVFTFLKFRSMYMNSDPSIHRRFVTQYINGNAASQGELQGHEAKQREGKKPVYKMRNDPRVTRVGHFLRRTSLDELPQLYNVIKGDMSLVGPRPALLYEVALYDSFHEQRLIPQAGLTGLWQVSGRTSLTFEQMIDLDVEYYKRRSLWLDLKILLKTFPAVISRVGAW